MALTQVKTNAIADDAVTTDKLADAINTERTANTAKATNATHTGDVTGSGALTIADNSVTLAKMAGLARGKIIYGDASGDPAALSVGSNGQVLKSDGTDISWGTDAGGKLLQVKDTLESDEVIVSTQATWTDLDTSLTITPTDATTKMVIWATVQGITKNSTCNWIGVRLLGSATSMTEFDRRLEWIYGYYSSAGANSPVQGQMGPVSTQVVHDHNTTNQITYKLQAIVYDHSDDEATFMVWANDNNTTSATIVVQEFST